jgi:hypothetical protein
MLTMAIEAVSKYHSRFFYTIQIFIPNSTGLAQEGFVFITTYITYSVTSYVVAGEAIGAHV